VSDLGEAALQYARHGLRVFPCEARGKRPLTKHGCLDATTDLGQIRGWWRRWPRANIGLATGAGPGWLVVDLDGAEGEANWAGLADRYGHSETLEQATGGGGRHLVFAYPAERELGNSAGKLATRIDTRGKGGYILVPPSAHPSGRSYRWRWPDDPARGDAGQGVLELYQRPAWALPQTPAPLPEWVLRLLTWTPPAAVVRACTSTTGDGTGLVRFVAQQEQGARNHGLFWAACRALERGLGDDVLDGLRLAAVGAGLPDWEARRTIGSARTRVGARHG
jgi:hypothetical protein